MPSPGGLFAFACIGGEKGLEGGRSGGCALYPACCVTDGGGRGRTSFPEEAPGKWPLREKPIKTEG